MTTSSFYTTTAPHFSYTLSLHDALPISIEAIATRCDENEALRARLRPSTGLPRVGSEEHTSELQSHSDLVCRLLLEEKNAEDRGILRADSHHRPLHEPHVCRASRRTQLL